MGTTKPSKHAAERSREISRIILNSKSTQDKEYMTKDEFYNGMEDAEMKGEENDPSAQEIYDEFNR